jgi:ferredoxin-NADP reductase
MIRQLLDRGERRDITLIYSTYGPEEIAYRAEIEQARSEIGLKVVYALADPCRVPAGWAGQVGVVDAGMIAEEVPHHARCLFYVSGPPAMVKALKSSLRRLGVHRVRTDFFPGYSV